MTCYTDVNVRFVTLNWTTCWLNHFVKHYQNLKPEKWPFSIFKSSAHNYYKTFQWAHKILSTSSHDPQETFYCHVTGQAEETDIDVRFCAWPDGVKIEHVAYGSTTIKYMVWGGREVGKQTVLHNGMLLTSQEENGVKWSSKSLQEKLAWGRITDCILNCQVAHWDFISVQTRMLAHQNFYVTELFKQLLSRYV